MNSDAVSNSPFEARLIIGENGEITLQQAGGIGLRQFLGDFAQVLIRDNGEAILISSPALLNGGISLAPDTAVELADKTRISLREFIKCAGHLQGR